MMANDSNMINDYLAEKDEQRIGADFERDERKALRDELFELETRAIQLKVYARGIAHVLAEYVEDCGIGVPPTLEHVSLSLWHLADDCSAFEADFDRAQMAATALIAAREL